MCVGQAGCTVGLQIWEQLRRLPLVGAFVNPATGCLRCVWVDTEPKVLRRVRAAANKWSSGSKLGESVCGG